MSCRSLLLWDLSPRGCVGKHLTVHPRLAQGPRGVWNAWCCFQKQASTRTAPLEGTGHPAMALREAARITLPLRAKGPSVLGGQVWGAPRAPGTTAPSWLGLNE